VNADEGKAWNDLHSRFEMRRVRSINLGGNPARRVGGPEAGGAARHSPNSQCRAAGRYLQKFQRATENDARINFTIQSFK
jgi:hypothetical protein